MQSQIMPETKKICSKTFHYSLTSRPLQLRAGARACVHVYVCAYACVRVLGNNGGERKQWLGMRSDRYYGCYSGILRYV